jgi:20S proteasome subunit beta 7
MRQLHQSASEEALFGDGTTLTPQDYSNYLASLAYARRNNQNPFFNNFVIAGYQGDQPHLCSVDLFGTRIVQDYVTAGFSKYFGLALIANHWTPNSTIAEAREILHKVFTIIYQRDCKSIDQVQFTIVNKDGVQILPSERVSSNWDYKEFRERKNEKLWQ